MAKRIGFGNYQYEVVEHWPKVEIRGAVADVCVDARGRVYAGVRNPREDGSVSNILGGIGHVLVLDRDGNEVGSWGNLASSPHGIWVNPAGEIYLADTGFHTITKHAPTGEVLLAIGTKGHKGPDGQPFNMPTHAVEAPCVTLSAQSSRGRPFRSTVAISFRVQATRATSFRPTAASSSGGWARLNGLSCR